MRRADAVEPAEARRHAYRAAGVGAERGVAEPARDRRRRARRRAARHMAGRARVHRRAVERVLPENAERHLVGDRLADQIGAGIEQSLHGPGVALRHRIGARPIRVAAARRMSGDIEQILRRKGQSGERAAGAALDAKPLVRDERADIVTARASVVCHLRPPLNTPWPGLSRPSTWILGTSPGMRLWMVACNTRS